MKMILSSLCFSMVLLHAAAQQGVGINANGSQPHASAILEVSSTSKGMLIPRMTAAQRKIIATPATGLQVYQTDGTAGFYYFDGTSWKQLGAASANFTGWALTGNAAINPATNFIGTSDAQPFIGKVNGLQVFSFSPGSTSTIIGTQASQATPAGGVENHIIGYKAGFSNTAFDNHFDGYQAGYSNTTGYSNLFIGFKAGYANTTSTNNLFIGQLAGYTNSTGANNHFVGNGAGLANTNGANNHFSGYQAGQANTIGNNNQFEGFEAGYNNTTGNNNFFQGYQSGYSNTTGTSNYFSGNNAGYFNTTGISNAFAGNSAGYNNNTGSNNNFSGHHAGFLNTSGKDNVANGSQALNSNTNGNSNTAIGRAALFSNTTGYSNIAIGAGASFSSTVASNNIAIGDSALFSNESIFFDPSQSIENTAIGSKAMFTNLTGYDNTVTGYYAMKNNSDGSGNTATGAWSMLNSLGHNNTAVGYFSLAGMQTGSGNVAVGHDALISNVTGYYNTAVGENSDIAEGVNSSSAFGEGAHASASHQVVIGSSTVTSIGGYTSWTNLSDGRFKKNIQENVSGLEFIKQLRPVTYTLDIQKLSSFSGEDKRNEAMKTLHARKGITIGDAINAAEQNRIAAGITNAENVVYSGFVAQEVETAAQKAGYNFSGIKKPQNDKDHYSLAYSDFVVPLVKAIQEQQKMIEDLTKEIELLKKSK